MEDPSTIALLQALKMLPEASRAQILQELGHAEQTASPQSAHSKKRKHRSRTSGGSIEELPNGKWRARLDLKKDPRTGKRKRVTSKGLKTYADAQAWLSKKVAERKEETLVAPSRMTVEAHVREWLETVIGVEARERTRLQYGVVMRNYVLRDLGHLRLDELERDTMQAHIATLKKRKLSERTIRYSFTILKSCLEWAVENKRMARNPIVRLRFPAKTHSERPTFDPVKVRALIQDVVNGPYGTLFVVAILSGMRPGELQALDWPHVDFDNNSLQVVRAMEWIDGNREAGVHRHWEIKEPKTEAGNRTVILPEWVMALLRRHQEEQARQKESLGELYEDQTGLVFTNTWGRPFHTALVTRKFLKPALERNGLPVMSFARLRRIAPTLLLAMGKSPRMAAERLGHADPTITLRVYSHLHTGAQQEASDALDSMLNPKASRFVSQARPRGRNQKRGTA